MVYTYIPKPGIQEFRCAVHIVAALSLVSHAPVDAGAQSGRRTKQLETLSLELPARLKQADLHTFPSHPDSVRSLGWPLATSGLLS